MLSKASELMMSCSDLSLFMSCSPSIHFISSLFLLLSSFQEYLYIWNPGNKQFQLLFISIIDEFENIPSFNFSSFESIYNLLLYIIHFSYKLLEKENIRKSILGIVIIPRFLILYVTNVIHLFKRKEENDHDDSIYNKIIKMFKICLICCASIILALLVFGVISHTLVDFDSLSIILRRISYSIEIYNINRKTTSNTLSYLVFYNFSRNIHISILYMKLFFKENSFKYDFNNYDLFLVNYEYMLPLIDILLSFICLIQFKRYKQNWSFIFIFLSIVFIFISPQMTLSLDIETIQELSKFVIFIDLPIIILIGFGGGLFGGLTLAISIQVAFLAHVFAQQK